MSSANHCTTAYSTTTNISNRRQLLWINWPLWSPLYSICTTIRPPCHHYYPLPRSACPSGLVWSGLVSPIALQNYIQMEIELRTRPFVFIHFIFHISLSLWPSLYTRRGEDGDFVCLFACLRYRYVCIVIIIRESSRAHCNLYNQVFCFKYYSTFDYPRRVHTSLSCSWKSIVGLFVDTIYDRACQE